ncbi:MAG: hypothetical protein JWP08_1189 [Bryobacterales bacterium]|nr:hypothetical protein [Bryobacterales bacterium]
MRARFLTAFLLAAAASRTQAQIPGLEYHATSSVEGVAPTSLVTSVIVTNRTAAPIELQYGDRPLELRAYRSADTSGQPVWRSELSGPPFMKKGWQGVTSLMLYERILAPGQSIGAPAFGAKIPTYEILADSLPDGRYYFTAQLELNNQKFTFDAGSAVISSKQQPLPTSRTVDSVQFSASVTRVTFGNGTPDSLDVKFKAHNTAKVTRWLRPDGNAGCIGIYGYKTEARRDSYYRRPAYDNDWIIRPCPFRLLELDLAAGESRTIVRRIPAPASTMHYMMYFAFWNGPRASQDPPVSGDISVEETAK